MRALDGAGGRTRDSAALPVGDMDGSPVALVIVASPSAVRFHFAPAAPVARRLTAGRSPAGPRPSGQVHRIPRVSPLLDRIVHCLHRLSADRHLRFCRPVSSLVRVAASCLVVGSRRVAAD